MCFPIFGCFPVFRCFLVFIYIGFGEAFAIFFSEFIDFVSSALSEKDFCFHEKELGVKVMD